MNNNNVPQSNAWNYAKSIALIAISIAISLRIYDAKVDITMDAPTLLSILLALFSVGLSALFYFKATDTSNKFYDNSYKYTKDVAELLVKIESGFGERLKNLDEGYASMRDHLQNGNSSDKSIENTKSVIQAEKDDVVKLKAERDELIEKLFKNSKLQKEEKDQLAKELEAKEQDLRESQRDISRLNKRLLLERMEKRESDVSHNIPTARVKKYTRNFVLPLLPQTSNLRVSTLNSILSEVISKSPERYLDDLIRLGYMTDDHSSWTRSGRMFIRTMMKASLDL